MEGWPVSVLVLGLLVIGATFSDIGLGLKEVEGTGTCRAGATTRTENRQAWDVLVLSLQWPPTMCKKAGEKCTRTRVTNNWTIHGLWPNQGGEKIICCNNKWHFNSSKIKDLRSEMEKQWSSLDKTIGDYKFWSHEWLTHGTCAAQQVSLDTQHKYFAETLKLRAGIDIYGMLAAADIMPSNSLNYTSASVREAIEKGLGYSFGLYCQPDKKFNYLFEVRICYDSTLGMVGCATMPEKQCHPKKKIKIPYFNEFEVFDQYK